MKVLLFTDNHDLKAGGAEIAFFRLKHSLEKEKIQVLSSGFGEYSEKNSKTIPDDSNIFLRQFWRTFENKKITNKIKKIIDEFSPDIIHLHNINKYTLSILEATKNYPTVMTCHDIRILSPTLNQDFSLLTPLIKLGHRRLVSKIKKQISTLIIPSPVIEKELKNIGFKVKIIPNLLEKIIPKKVKEENFILYAGGLHKMKGYNILLDAFLEAKTDMKLYIAGKGPEKKTRNKKIKYLGRVELDNYYRKAKYVIVPSIVPEQFGFVTAEAMQHGKAVIGSNKGSTPWLVGNNKTGIVINPNAGELKKAIESLTEEKIKKYGEAGKQRINKIVNNKEIIKNTIKIYYETKNNFRRK